MKFLSPRPQTLTIQKDRLGNTIPPSRETPFAVTIWVTVTAGIIAGSASRFLREAHYIHHDFWLRMASTLVAVLAYGALCLLNRALNRFEWYRDFKRSPLLNSVTIIILIGFILRIFVFKSAGK